ncbi:flagellar hook-basal body complex protein [Candidatus Halocynthiibacter alkanivorans]|jgi:flagellar basal-body rod protein FlgF|uniref:flagellar hook-basal body complex protein n=1 Tax=Candidatus Halocynthiibacter alkanivorans TaxID=2267619 RepID=UPI000DF2AF44|nr:flagellar hook-basal body complex protein [Candidatus Halocynthiibacter alkanivorans]
METPTYTTLSRQTGLMSEMQAIANNIANISTAGFRKEGLIFSEQVAALEPGEPSLSMAVGDVRVTSSAQGPLSQTGGTFDFAIEGDGFFMLETPDGEALTRAGVFTPNEAGELVNMDGFLVLDSGGAPIFIPSDAKSIALASDGTLSADGQPLTQLGVFMPEDPNSLNRRDGVSFIADGATFPVEEPVVLQGFVEGSNVNAVSEVARMIEVQRAYEMGATFLEKEDERIRGVLTTLGR